MANLLQYIYGKQSLSETKSVGKKYECLGRSSKFPKALYTYAQPKSFDVGIDGKYNWSQSKITQAYSLRFYEHAGQKWLMASSVKGLSVDKSNRSSNKYTQSISLAEQASSYNHLILPKIVELLNPVPVHKKDMDKAALTCSGMALA